MKEKVTAIISFIGGIGFSLFGISEIMTDLMTSSYIRMDDYYFAFGFLMTTVSTVLYVFWTKFGKKDSEIENIDRENQILKRKIEQKELKKKLEE